MARPAEAPRFGVGPPQGSAAARRGRPAWAEVALSDGIGVEPDHVRLADGRVARTLAVVGYPRRVDPGWLQPLYAFPAEMRVACHIVPLDSAAAVEELTRQARRLQASLLLAEARQALRDAYDEAALGDALALRDALARGQVRLFAYQLVVTLAADDLRELDRLTAALLGEMQGRMLVVRRCLLQQAEGLASALPLGRMALSCARNFDSEAVATAFPYTAGDFQRPCDEVWGVDLQHGCLAAVPRWLQPNAHVVCVAASGAGKSYWMKSLLTQALLARGRVVVLDPQGEYTRWAAALGGAVLQLGPGSRHRVNPFLTPDGEARARPTPRGGASTGTDADPALGAAAGRLLNALQLLGPVGADERAAAWNAARRAWAVREGLRHPLTAWLRALAIQGDAAGARLADRFGPVLVDGLSTFDGGPALPPGRALTVLDLSAIVRRSSSLAAAAYYLLAELVRDQLIDPRLPPLTLAVDEAHHLLAHAPSARFLEVLFRAGRKLGVGVCLITQSVGDLLGEQADTDAARATRAALANAGTAFLMRQHNAREAEWLQRLYRLSPVDAEWLLRCGQGEGLAVSGRGRARVRVLGPPGMHDLFRTDPASGRAGPARAAAARPPPARAARPEPAARPGGETGNVQSGDAGRQADARRGSRATAQRATDAATPVHRGGGSRLRGRRRDTHRLLARGDPRRVRNPTAAAPDQGQTGARHGLGAHRPTQGRLGPAPGVPLPERAPGPLPGA